MTKISPYNQRRDRINQLSGHHFEPGAKVDLLVKYVDSFLFNTKWGQKRTIALETENEQILFVTVDMLAKVDTPEGFFPVTGTIKHAAFRGRKETRLLRAKWDGKRNRKQTAEHYRELGDNIRALETERHRRARGTEALFD